MEFERVIVRSAAGEKTAIGHLPSLDGVRGMAILLVMACHTTDNLATQTRWTDGVPRWLHLTFGAGWIGVDLFFVLSGFLITRILLATSEQSRYFRNFYARRSLRILPLYVAFLLLMTVLYVRAPVAGGKGDLLSLAFYYNNAREALVGWHTGLASQCWSLAVEEHFYLLWPLVLWFVPRQRVGAVCLAGIGLSFAMRLLALNVGLVPHAVYVLTPFRLDGLLAGGWLAYAYDRPDTWARVRVMARPLMAVSLAGLLLIAVYQGHFFDSVNHAGMNGLRHSSRATVGPGLLLLALFFGTFLVETLRGGVVSRVMRWRWLRSVGTYSYGMYLFHLYLMVKCQNGLERTVPGIVGSWMSEPVLLVMVAVVTYGCAYVSYNVYERRFLELKRRFASTSVAVD